MEQDRSLAEVIVGVIIGSVIGLLCTTVIFLLIEHPETAIDPKISVSALLSLILTSSVGIYVALSINRQNAMFSAKISDVLTRQQGVAKAQRDEIGDYCKSIRTALEAYQTKIDTFYDTVSARINNSTAAAPNPTKEDLERFFENDINLRFANLADILVDFKILKVDKTNYALAVEPGNLVYNAYMQANDMSGSYLNALFPPQIDFNTISGADLIEIRKGSRSSYHAIDLKLLLFKTVINRQDSLT